MAAPVCDDSTWPIVAVQMPAEEISSKEWADYVRQLGDWTGRAERFVMILDLRHARPLNASQRKSVAAEVQEQGRGEVRLAGLAHVVDGAIMRGVLTAVSWIANPRYPTKAFGSVTEARVWAKKLLDS